MPRTINPSGIRKNNTKITDDGKVFQVTLHNTVIFKDYGDHCELHIGGYNTPTTIRRMNECLYHRGYVQRVCKADFNDTTTISFGK